MLLVLALIGGVWLLGWRMGQPARIRAVPVALILGGVVLAHLVLPDGHPIRAATGGSAEGWLIGLGLAALAGLYGFGVAKLKARAQPLSHPKQEGFSEAELDRYSRHIVLREIGGPGQTRLRTAKVLVIGAGGLGAPALQYLGAAGIGTIGIIDDDQVENSNLQRQVIHRDADIGRAKAHSAAEALGAQNPHITLRPYTRRLTDDIADELIAEYDVVLDGSDNAETRYVVNAACARAGVPLVSGALSQWEGQLSTFDPARGSPCYACVFPDPVKAGLAPSCSEAGVLGPLPGVIGAMMAVETVKLLTGAGAPLRGTMLIYDALWGETRQITLTRNPECPVCGAPHQDNS